MVTNRGSRIPLADAEFDDFSLGLSAKWKFKAPSSLQPSISKQEETIVISSKTAESGMLALGQDTDCTWAEPCLIGNRALLLQRQKAPASTKLLELQHKSQSNYLRTHDQDKLKEISPLTAILPHDKDDLKWTGFVAALASLCIEKDSARCSLKEHSLSLIPLSLLKEEVAARTHLLSVLSASTAAESLAASHEDT